MKTLAILNTQTEAHVHRGRSKKIHPVGIGYFRVLFLVIIERKPEYESEKDIYISPYIDLLISNNFYSMTFCATRILRVIGRQSIRQSTDFLLIFWHNKKNTSKIKFIK